MQNFLFFSAEAHDRISHKVSIIVPMIPIRGRPGRTQNETTNTQAFKQACACEGGQWGEEVSLVPFTGPSTHKLSAATERLDAKLTKLADKPHQLKKAERGSRTSNGKKWKHF